MPPIESAPLHLAQIPPGFGPLTEDQRVYLNAFKAGRTIAQTVEAFLESQRLVSFTQLFDLVEKLHDGNLVRNPAFKAYFDKIRKLEDESHGKNLASLVKSLLPKREEPAQYLQKHPFFRSQSPLVTSLFCQHAEVIEVKAGTKICNDARLERELFFLIEGEAAIYKQTETQGRRMLGLLGKDAVIGEVGFFVGELRTADVVCTKPSKLVMVRYEEKAFGRIINKDIARNLQVRFRVVHALTKSPFLKGLPEEAMDSLMFAGQTRQAKEFETLTKENELGHSCFIIVSGSVVITKGTKNINVLGAGDAFGEIALFFTQGKRTATAMAQRDTLLLEIHARDFYRILGGNILLGREFERLALQRAERLRAA